VRKRFTKNNKNSTEMVRIRSPTSRTENWDYELDLKNQIFTVKDASSLNYK